MPRHPRRCSPPLRRRGPQATLRHALRGPRPPGAAHRPHAPGSRRGAASLPAAPQLRLRLLSFVSTLLKRIAYSNARSHPMQLASPPHQFSRSTMRGLALHLRPQSAPAPPPPSTVLLSRARLFSLSPALLPPSPVLAHTSGAIPRAVPCAARNVDARAAAAAERSPLHFPHGLLGGDGSRRRDKRRHGLVRHARRAHAPLSACFRSRRRLRAYPIRPPQGA